MKKIIRRNKQPANQVTEPTQNSKMIDSVWRILVVDDELDIHAITRLALADFKFLGKGLEVLQALSAREARIILEQHDDIMLAIIDVVMETDDAGLQLVDFIRNQQKNTLMRLIIRTGQPDSILEREVVERYNIDYYKEKNELTAIKLHTTVHLAIASAIEYHEQFHQKELLLKQVQQLNAGLEQKVAEKTQSLTETLAELVKNNAALELARQAAVDAAESKALFLANMSHEIRTPMNAVISMTELLMDTPLEIEQKDWLKIILDSGESLLSLINDILDFSKIEAGKLNLEKVPFKLSDCVESSLDLLAIRAAQLSLNFSYYIEPNVPNNLLGDSTRLRQILLNLLSNALKFTEKGEVNVDVCCLECNDKQAKLQFAINDTGIGIADDKLKNLFQAFTQAELSITRQYGGTGLGLTISKRLSELMQGEIWVDSIIGKGCCFYFSIVVDLPIKADIRPNENQVFANKKILLCSDCLRSKEHQLKLLEHWQCQVTTVSFEQVVDNLPQESWDCVIVDFGYNQQVVPLLKTVRAHCLSHNQPILLLIDKTQESFNLDKANIARKPLKRNNLNQQLQNLLGVNTSSISPFTSTAHQKNLSTENRPLRILLAEDNKVNQTVALLRLKKLGYRADIANNGLEALEALEMQTYDVILMDVQMPEMDGLTATQEILKRWAGRHDKMPYIIAMTANAMQGDKQICLDVGMHDYLSKPVRSENLYTALVKAADFKSNPS
jgi:signal transduction histidine kinase/BarA-like signal transduction histidine kinase